MLKFTLHILIRLTRNGLEHNRHTVLWSVRINRIILANDCIKSWNVRRILYLLDVLPLSRDWAEVNRYHCKDYAQNFGGNLGPFWILRVNDILIVILNQLDHMAFQLINSQGGEVVWLGRHQQVV